MPEHKGKGKEYTGERITVTYDASRCIHFAECVRGLPAVFDVNQRPWIQVDRADAELIAEVVRRCPSGALHYELHDGGQPEQATSPTVVEPILDGPLNLRGDLVIDTADGQLAETRASLCRCGLTGNQPFCDHECQRAGWKSAPAAG